MEVPGLSVYKGNNNIPRWLSFDTGKSMTGVIGLCWYFCLGGDFTDLSTNQGDRHLLLFDQEVQIIEKMPCKTDMYFYENTDCYT